MDALKSASTMLAELRTSSLALSPKQYYELCTSEVPSRGVGGTRADPSLAQTWRCLMLCDTYRRTCTMRTSRRDTTSQTCTNSCSTQATSSPDSVRLLPTLPAPSYTQFLTPTDPFWMPPSTTEQPIPSSRKPKSLLELADHDPTHSHNANNPNKRAHDISIAQVSNCHFCSPPL